MLFDSELVARLDRIQWLNRVSRREAVATSDWQTEQLEDYSQSSALLDAWCREINRALGDLQYFFHANSKEHGRQWNQLVDEANAVIRTTVQPRAMPALQAGSYEKRHSNLLASEVKIALIEVQFRKLGTPRFFENLLEVYEAGHLPCGWRGESPPEEVEKRELAANYFPMGTLLYW